MNSRRHRAEFAKGAARRVGYMDPRMTVGVELPHSVSGLLKDQPPLASPAHWLCDLRHKTGSKPRYLSDIRPWSASSFVRAAPDFGTEYDLLLMNESTSRYFSIPHPRIFGVALSRDIWLRVYSYTIVHERWSIPVRPRPPAVQRLSPLPGSAAQSFSPLPESTVQSGIRATCEKTQAQERYTNTGQTLAPCCLRPPASSM